MTTVVEPEAERADQLLQAAHRSGYRLPPDFAGFTAALHAIDQANEVTATVTVRGPRDVTIDDTTAAREGAQEGRAALLKWARREVASMVGHRWAREYAEGDGRWNKIIGPDTGHPSGEFVRLDGDPFDSAYRVQHGHLTEVHRTANGTRFTIVLSARTPIGDQHLPSAFSVYYWQLDENGEKRALGSVETYHDSYASVDGVHLPAGRRVTAGDATGLHTRQFSLAEHALLGA